MSDSIADLIQEIKPLRLSDNPVLFPQSKPLHFPSNRLDNLQAALRYTVNQDGKKLKSEGLAKALRAALGLKCNSSILLTTNSLLPFDSDPASATLFAKKVHVYLEKNSVWSCSYLYICSLIARSLGYTDWVEYMFQLAAYNEFMKGNWQWDGKALSQPVVSDGGVYPMSVLFPGISVSRYGALSCGWTFILQNNGSVWEGRFINSVSPRTMSRFWGQSASDLIAWMAAQILWCIGPVAWNTTISLSRSDLSGEREERRYIQAEKHMIQWEEERYRIAKKALRSVFLV